MWVLISPQTIKKIHICEPYLKMGRTVGLSCSFAINGVQNENSSFPFFSLCSLTLEPFTKLRFVWVLIYPQTIKKVHISEPYLKMGRTVGFEPTYIGTTIRGLNRLAMPAISN